MAEIPENEVTMQDIIAWSEAAERLTAAKNTEILLRNRIFKGKFPNPVEGTNSVALLNDYVLKAKYDLNRKVDVEAVTTLREELVAVGINTTELIKYKPELDVRAYKSLNEDQRKIFDQCLQIKPGTPSLEIVLPKRISNKLKADEIPRGDENA